MKTTKRKRDAATTPGKAKSPAGRTKAVHSPAAPAAAPVAESAPVAASVAIESPAPVAMPEAASAPVRANSVVLARTCTVREAAALKESLARLMDAEDVILEAGNLERIDTATVQLLCAFVRDRAKASRKVTWAGDSSSLRDAARLLGVADMLALPPGEAA